MVSVKEHISRTIEELTDKELQLVAEYLAFLKFRARTQATPQIEETQLAELYAESAEEDHLLAEEGMEEYTAGLREEDRQ